MRWFGLEHEYLIVNEHPRDDFPAETDKVKVQFLTTKKPPGVTGSTPDLSYLAGIDKCDKIVYSPTSYWNLKRAFGSKPSFWDKTTTVLHIFFEEAKTKNIIGVTGTKGKGTTATLIHLMLKAAGFNPHLGGNIGTSVLDLLPEAKSDDDWVVLELSSFQLFYFPYSPHISICLKIVPEHLDWHPSLEDYIEAKANIFRHQTEEDVAIYFAGNRYSEQIAGYSAGQKVPYFAPPGAQAKDEGVIVVGPDEKEVIMTEDIKLIGDHNLENVCAAVTAYYQISQDLEPAQEVLSTFAGLEHRLEFVREVDGVKYYDDSFGTTPDTAVVAIRSFVEPKILILGGSDKGIPFDPLADEVAKARVKHVIAIGQTGHVIAELLRKRGFKDITEGLTSMSQIVSKAHEVAEPGDVVLLSTACASFGMFRDYKDRGEQFKQAVLKLA